MEVKTNNYRVRLAFEWYSVGQIIQPVGLWRSHLLSRGYIEPVIEEEPAESLPAGGGADTEKPKRGRPRKTEATNGV